MKGKSIKGTSPEEIKTALQQSMADGFTPTLAIVFISIKQDRNAICTILDDAGIAIFGASTNGEFIDEVTEKGSVAILLLDINKNYRGIRLIAYIYLFKNELNGYFQESEHYRVYQTLPKRSGLQEIPE